MPTIPFTSVKNKIVASIYPHVQEIETETSEVSMKAQIEKENVSRQVWIQEISKEAFKNDYEREKGYSPNTLLKSTQSKGLNEPLMPVVQGIPYRPIPSIITKSQAQIHLPQSAIMSSVDSSDSVVSSNRSSSSNDYSHKRVGSDHPQENQQDYDRPESQHEYESEAAPVPQFRYHHQKNSSENLEVNGTYHTSSIDTGQPTGNHLSPSLHPRARNYVPRPLSTYSDLGPGRNSSGLRHNNSPRLGARATSNHSSHLSYDGRPMSYIDLANTSYPQAPPPPISLDNSQLRSVVGSNASLLSTAKTIEMYRQNLKKLNDSETQYAFAIYLIQAAQESGLGQEMDSNSKKPITKNGGREQVSQTLDQPSSSPQDLLQEAKHVLQRLANQSYPFAQYYLADGYASGLFNKGKEDYSTAFPLFVAASKHGHAESGYRAALCYEFGWGCRKDPAKAVQFYRQSASKNHPGSMTRLGRACLSGELGLNKYREGLKWLKRATESADLQYNAAPYHLGLLYETGYGDDIFRDEAYAAQLFTQAADLGHAEACFHLGEAYELGKLSCPRDPALSVHFYTNAAQANHAGAMMALCAWYIVGAEPVLEKDENEAYEWARLAAGCGLAKAQYAVGYFTEMGIGTRPDPLEANVYYVKAAEAGDERAKVRLAAIRAAASGETPDAASSRNTGKIRKTQSGNEKAGTGDKDCIIM